MNALHEPVSRAHDVMGDLNAIVGSGDMKMQDLLDTFKSGLIPAAKASGVSLRSLGAALSVMGDMGQKGAMAGTRLRMAIALLSAPSEEAAGVLEKLHLGATQATSDSKAMATALADAGCANHTAVKRPASARRDPRRPARPQPASARIRDDPGPPVPRR